MKRQKTRPLVKLVPKKPWVYQYPAINKKPWDNDRETILELQQNAREILPLLFRENLEKQGYWML